jgi:hypothetical protein
VKKLNSAFAFIFLLVLAPILSVAQVVINPGGGSSGSSAITIGTTTITGGATTQVLYNLAGVAQSSSNLTYSGGTTTVDNGAAAVSPFIVKDNGTAVFTIADGGTTTMTAPLLLPAGTAGAPGWGWSADADGTGTGLYRRAADRITISTAGTGGPEFSGGDMYITSAANLAWLSGAVGTGIGLNLSQEAAATLQLGVDVNGAAVAQTIKAHDGITGTDIAGANLTLAGGRGTGAGANGLVKIQTSLPGATGTTAQTLRDAAQFGKTVTLTEAGAAELVITITTATTQSFGLELSYQVRASDATPDYAVREGSLKMVCVNKATAVTCTKDATTQADDESVVISTSAKTLTYAIAADVATANVAKITFDIDSDMTVTGASITFTAILNGSGTIS